MIRRVDECGRSTFFYHNQGKQGQGKIFVEYSGINDGFSGYLKFEETGRVVLLSGDGHFQMQDFDTTNFIYKRIYSYSRPTLDDAVYQIMLLTKHEIERNAKSQSTVKAKYRIDERVVLDTVSMEIRMMTYTTNYQMAGKELMKSVKCIQRLNQSLKSCYAGSLICPDNRWLQDFLF